MSQSLALAVASLVFLVVIHKLEYFLDARIVGAQIQRQAVGAAARDAGDGGGTSGSRGSIAAPIYYAYLKDELAVAQADRR